MRIPSGPATGALIWLWLLLATPAAAMNFIIELDQADLQRRVERLFPIAHDDALYRVVLDQPQVILREGSDRIGLGLAMTGTVLQQLSVAGRTQLDGRLRFEPESGAFYLDDATLAELVIDGVPSQYSSELHHAAEQAARELLATRPIYVLGQSGESTQVMGREIKAIAVRKGKLVIELAMF